jgi:poly-gamma-glutamate system protein
MYRPTIKSNLWLGLMAVVFMVIYYWSENSVVTVRPENYDDRIQAAAHMQTALKGLSDFRFPMMDDTDQITDSTVIYQTMLGDKYSPITTDEGSIDEKTTVLNPDFAGIMVDMFEKAGVKSGSTVAVLLTGSMPGANIAVYSAAKALDLELVVTTSVGSSWWGANSPDFTWLDMERVLFESDIFKYRSVAASVGGSDDNGGLRLSDVGRQLITEAIDRNSVIHISEGSLSQNIKARQKLYERTCDINKYSAIVNVGGGIAGLGHTMNNRLIPTGVNNHLPQKNYPGKGIIHHFADAGVPVILLYDVLKIADEYELLDSQLQFSGIGTGKVYEHKQYDMVIATTGLILMFLILALVKYFDMKLYKWREEKVKPDSLD